MSAKSEPLSSAEQLGQVIQRARVARGLSHREVGDRCGVSPDVSKAWESGELVPTSREWARLTNMVHRGLRVDAMLWRDARARLTSPRDAENDMQRAATYATSAEARLDFDPEARIDSEPPEMPRAEDATTVGEALRRARIIEGVTQEDIAALVGVGDSSVSTWELGNGMPVRENFDKLVQLVPTLERWRADCADRSKPPGNAKGASNVGHVPSGGGKTATMSIVQSPSKTLEELGVDLAHAMLDVATHERVVDELMRALELERTLLQRAHANVENVQRELHDVVSKKARAQ